MKIISWNVNGIRAVERKGDLDDFLKKYNPDIFLIQEIKANPEQLSEALREHPEYLQFYHPAVKPGYAGTAIWIRRNEFNEVKFLPGMPDFSDDEGRVSRVDFDDYSILGVYFPNGGKSSEAWEGKLMFYENFLNYINEIRKMGQKVIFAGDVNCAHEAIDLARPKENEGKIGFHSAEREWLDRWITQGWIDVWRAKFPKKTEVYSWWHVITRSRLRNVGWRIDYFFIDKDLLSEVKNIEYLTDQMGSDHCPVLLEI